MRLNALGLQQCRSRVGYLRWQSVANCPHMRMGSVCEVGRGRGQGPEGKGRRERAGGGRGVPRVQAATERRAARLRSMAAGGRAPSILTLCSLERNSHTPSEARTSQASSGLSS
eukprot:3242988-Pleurochrysis_carterae.AAC.1